MPSMRMPLTDVQQLFVCHKIIPNEAPPWIKNRVALLLPRLAQNLGDLPHRQGGKGHEHSIGFDNFISLRTKELAPISQRSSIVTPGMM